MKTRTNLFNRLQRNFLRCLTSGVFILGGIGGVSAQPLLDPVELLSDFVGVLRTISAKSGDCVISKACSSTMPNPAKWPFLRFKNAAKFYENEISSVIYTMSSDDGGGGGADAIVIEVSE